MSTDKPWKRLMSRVSGLGRLRVNIGVFSKETHDNSDLTLIHLMAIHEFGAPEANIPERAPIRKTFIMKKAEYRKMVGQLVKLVLAEKLTMLKATEILGMWGASEVRSTIVAGVSPPNAPSTIKRKGSSTPLVDTGQLLNSITFEVKL